MALEEKSDNGGRQLARDVSELKSTRSEGLITIASHSFGAVVTGAALRNYGLADSVNQVVVLEGPGLGREMRSIKDLHLRGGQLYVGSSSHDRVTYVPLAHGWNPVYGGEGVVRIKTESLDRSGLDPIADHSRYLDPDVKSKPGHVPESILAITEITPGHAGRLASMQLLAAPRKLPDPVWVTKILGLNPFVTDPESQRIPETYLDGAG